MTRAPGNAGAPAVVIVGPTASGKSEIALALAQRFGGWILSVDSMAVYRGLDIGTSKPPKVVRERVPHRGLDLEDPDRDYSLGDFLRAADEALSEMLAAGAVPILVGGTGLYLRGILKGVSDLPRRNPHLRKHLLLLEEVQGAGTLHRLLQEKDPVSAGRIAPSDRQRLVRALELAEQGIMDTVGRAREEWRSEDRFPSVKVGLLRSRVEITQRITRRVDAFLEAGLLEETRGLMERYPQGGNAFKALGYRELAAHLRGECDLPAARELIIRNTLRYAKRQMTWFRKERDVQWFEVSGPIESAARRIGDYVAERIGSTAGIG
ncbi:MAG: tRNA (adenosine(37)-N6)-dimethylallyltransferase MiaA [Acidobacteria bacterium]|nr:tRNA (adenosine(37)-N6)-dimethylallyltransferase MiaA [Acidobacteriota bacterium]